MNTYLIYSSQKVYYRNKIEAESEDVALKIFIRSELNGYDELGTIEIDNIDLIEKGN